MKISLINTNREKSPWPVPPIGLCSIASNLEKHGYEVEVLDLCFERKPLKFLETRINKFEPNLIGVHLRNIDNVNYECHKSYIDFCDQVVTTCRELRERTPIVLGGSAINISAKTLMEKYINSSWVYAIAGDGEDAIVQMAQGNLVCHIDGMVRWGTNDSRKPPFIVEEEIARVKDINTLPFPKVYKWIDLDKYLKYGASLGVQTKRGCPLSCIYCPYNEIEGRTYRLRSPEKVVEEIKDIAENSNCDQIEFVDSTFNLPLDHAKNICKLLKEEKLDMKYTTMGINPCSVDKELIQLFNESGFIDISITPESASPTMLKSLQKNFTVDDVKRAVDICKEENMRVIWYFMFGGPNESRETVQETLDFISKNVSKKDLVFFSVGVRVLEGTPLQSIVEAKNGISDDYVQPVWYQPDNISISDIAKMVDKFCMRNSHCILMQDNIVPAPILRVVNFLRKKFTPNKPIWIYLKYAKRIMNAFGIKHLPS